MQNDREMEQAVAQIRRAAEGLSKLTFPSLLHPQPAPDGAPTCDLVNFAVRVYCYSLLSHFREMLRSYLFLGENGHIPAAFVVCRCLFEMGAHAYYVHKHVTQHMDGAELEAAWKFLFEINMGSRYMQEEYGEVKDWPPFSAPREIAKVIRCFDEWTGRNGQAVTEYSFLSEFAHPNMAAFQHYYEIKRGPSGSIRADFSSSFSAAPIPYISFSLTSALRFTLKLLERTSEPDVSPSVRTVLAEFENAPPT